MTTATETKPFHTATRTVDISRVRVAYLVIGAIETPFGDHIEVIDSINPAPNRTRNHYQHGGELECEDLGALYSCMTCPEGGSVTFQVENPNEQGSLKVNVGAEQLRKGLDLMAQHHPRHFNDFIDENDDAITSDVLLQLAIYGEVIFG